MFQKDAKRGFIHVSALLVVLGGLAVLAGLGFLGVEKYKDQYADGQLFKVTENSVVNSTSTLHIPRSQDSYALPTNDLPINNPTNNKSAQQITIDELEGNPKDPCSWIFYYTDGDSVYVRRGFKRSFELIPEADAETFRILWDCKEYEPLQGAELYAVDKDHVYYYGPYPTTLWIVQGAEPSTFSLLEEDFPFVLVRDKSSLYYNGRKLVGSDGSPLRQIATSTYYRDDNNVYLYIYSSYGYHQFISLEADPGSLVILNGGFARDRDHLYLRGKKVEKGDPDTFVDLPGPYWKDKNQAYVYRYAYEGGSGAHVIEDADADTLEVLEGDPLQRIAKDKDSLFLYWNRLKDINPDTFRVLQPTKKYPDYSDSFYATDGVKVLFFEVFEMPTDLFLHVVENADPTTFKSFDDIFATDKTSLYGHGKVVKDITPTTLSSLGHGFVRSGGAIIKGSSVISCPKCELNSFVVLNREYAKDATTVYHLGTAHTGPTGYYSIQNRTSYFPIEEADINTFWVEPDDIGYYKADARDKNNLYRDGEIYSETSQ
jgi:hypothetical protein